MSYTLRGRIESRLAAVLLPFLAACVATYVLGAWWPLELMGAMLAAGLVLDVVVYDRVFAFQPGWLALPLGALELGATMVLVRWLDIAAPLKPAIWFFVASWLVAQILGHAGLPLLRLSYAEDGGELGEAGLALLLAAPLAALIAVGTASVTQPPTVYLSAGVHQGPLVLDHALTLVGEPGTIVKGGIVVTADDVTVRDVTVSGGRNGITVGADHRVHGRHQIGIGEAVRHHPEDDPFVFLHPHDRADANRRFAGGPEVELVWSGGLELGGHYAADRESFRGHDGY